VAVGVRVLRMHWAPSTCVRETVSTARGWRGAITTGRGKADDLHELHAPPAGHSIRAASLFKYSPQQTLEKAADRTPLSTAACRRHFAVLNLRQVCLTTLRAGLLTQC